jgi:hypothetical protein
MKRGPNPKPTPAQTIRIMLAIGHPILRDGLHRLLEAECGLKVIGEACDGAEAVNLARIDAVMNGEFWIDQELASKSPEPEPPDSDPADPSLVRSPRPKGPRTLPSQRLRWLAINGFHTW